MVYLANRGRFLGARHGRREYYGSASTGDALAKYRRDGYALLPKLFSDAEVDDILARIALCRDDERLKRDQRGDQLNIVFWSARVDPALDALRSSERLLGIVEAVLGTADVKQHIQHIYFRDLGNRDSFRWHRDEIFRGPGLAEPRRSYVALAIYLDDVTSVDQGAVLYVPGSHLWGEGRGARIGAGIEGRAGGSWGWRASSRIARRCCPARDGRRLEPGHDPRLPAQHDDAQQAQSAARLCPRRRRRRPSYVWAWKRRPLAYAAGAEAA